MNNDLFQQARAAYAAKDYNGALGLFTQCLQDPSSPAGPGEAGLIYHQIGNCLIKLKNPGEAIHAYTQATADAAYGAGGAVSYNLGMAYASLHDYEDAVKHYEAAVSDERYETPYKAYSGMGNALLIAGSYGMAGAAVLAAKACMRSGTGKTTIITPETNRCIIQTSVPEAVLRIDPDERIFSEAIDTDAFDAVGIGPGLGTDEETAVALMSQLRRTKCPVVLDADALNIISNHRTWMQHLPANLILTPHPKELDRLYGSTASSDYDRLNNARNLAEHLEAYVILKGHYSALCTPDGSVTFNTTGNAGMATAGSGDVLTGIITGLLARGYARNQACLTGMYIHGLAGDIAARETGEESLVASDIIKCIPKAFKQITDN